MKKLFSIVIAVVMCLALSITAFAAEVDLSSITGAAQNYGPHGYPDAYGIELGYGNKTYLGEFNLADYKEVKITYASDNSYTAFKDGMACNAFFALCSAEVSVGQVETGPQNADKILAKVDAEDASVTNPAGTNWDKNERTAVIDLSTVDYSGKVWMAHYNATASSVLVVGIEFVEAEAGVGDDITDTPSVSDEAIAVDSIDDILADQDAEYVLTADIDADLTNVNFTNCTVVIDLAGYTWESGNIVLKTGEGADVTVIDSVGGGKLVSTGNDAVQPEGGKLTLDGITVESQNADGDALFVDGGTVIIKDTTLVAEKAGIDVSQNGNSAEIIVDGVTFAGFETADSRTCAIEIRNNDKTVELKGNIKFETNLILRRNECTKDLSEIITTAEGCTVTFGEDASVEGYDNYKGNTVEYTYTPSADDNTGDNTGDVETGDFMSFAFVIAAAALVVTVISKKRAY